MPHTNPWVKRFQVGLPLILGVSLITVFVVLLFSHPSAAPPREPKPKPRVTVSTPPDVRFPVHPITIPRHSPSGNVDAPVAGEGLKRWNIDPLPEGWDPEVAAKLAELFGLIDYDPSKPDSYFAAGEAWDNLQEHLKTLDPDALPTLAAILNAESTYLLRQQILKGIGQEQMGDGATFILKDFFAKRVGDLKARSEMNHVIAAFGRLKNDTAFNAMTNYMDEDIPLYYKDKFIVELGEHPRRAERKDLFKTMMLEGGNSNLRNHSAQALRKFGAQDDLPDLYDAYEREKRTGHWMIRQTIVGTIGRIGSPSSIPFLEDIARFAKEDGVRLSAASSLRRVGTPAAWAILDDISRSEKNTGVRGRILG